ncbi:MAG: response regulator [Chloroflexales bacterium]|nr:response regulator [Chloroflexales bacterium]
MSRQGRILIVDDLETWRSVLGGTLERSGFHVETATSIADARERMVDSFFHLIVLDIRMQDSDQDNEEGIQLLRELDRYGLNEAMKVIILSAYGTKEQMRTAFRDLKVTDFLSKDTFDNLDFLSQVRQMFNQEMQINLNLVTHWQQISGSEQAVLNVAIAGTRIKRNTPQHLRAAAELDDLLCRLFYEAESLLIRPLTAGRSGAGVLWVQPFFTAGGGQSVAVKYGDVHAIEEEQRRFRAHVQPFIGGGRSTTVRDARRTAQLGGIAYSFLGTAGDQLEDFGSFYQQAELPAITDILERLFRETCGGWYANPGRLQLCNLTEEYQQLLNFTPEKLEEAHIERLKSVQGKQKLTFTALESERTFANPISAIAGQALLRSTYICTTHGDLNEHNILVDPSGHSWLIDFLRTGPGHILRDVALLDTSVRFHLLTANEATLAERFQMEEVLCKAERFSQIEQLPTELPNTNPSLANAYATTLSLRKIARRLVAQNTSDDISEYSIALFYYAVNTIRFYGLPVVQREHALLSASLLAERLGL